MNETGVNPTAFLHLIDTLMVTYTPLGVHTWLGSPNGHLDGWSPLDVWMSGDHDKVLEVASWIEGR